MKVIDGTPTPAKENSLSKLTKSFQDILDKALSPEKDSQAQDVFINHMNKTLGGKFVLLRNFVLEGLDLPIPMILIGPPGIYVIYASARKGVLRAKNEVLSEMNRSRDFVPSRPDLISRTMLMTRAVDAHLKKRGYEVPEVQCLLFFSNPGTHVDSQRPAIRIVLIDGLDHLSAGILQAHPVFTREDIQELIDAFITPLPAPESVQEPAPGTEQTPAVEPEQAPVEEVIREGLGAKQMQTLSKKVRLTTKQLIFLGVMAFFEILILIGFVVLILTTLK